MLRFAFSPRFEGQAGYMLAAGAVAVVFVVRLALQQILGDTAIFILFVPVILITAIAGGIGPGILALALSLAGGSLHCWNSRGHMGAKCCLLPGRADHRMDGRDATPRTPINR